MRKPGEDIWIATALFRICDGKVAVRPHPPKDASVSFTILIIDLDHVVLGTLRHDEVAVGCVLERIGVQPVVALLKVQVDPWAATAIVCANVMQRGDSGDVVMGERIPDPG